MGTPVVVIGLDGASFEWLRPLAREGVTPNLAALIDGGSAAPLISTMPPLTPPGWATCLTGVSPRQHGVWDFVRRASTHRYDLLPTSGSDVCAPWIWNRLDRCDRRSIVLNLPFSYPARPLNGQMVCGFDTTDRRRASYPTHLLEELEVSLEGPYPFFYQVPARHIRKLFPNAANALPIGDEERSSLLEVVAESRRFTRGKLGAATALVARDPFDFLFVHVFETDHLSHEAWPAISDPGHPDRALLLEYFRELDEGIGRLIEACYQWEEPVVVLVSDHGFGRCTRRLLLNDWLVQEGLLTLQGGDGRPQAASWDRIDWTRTRAYAIQTGIYLNTKENHPAGTIDDRDTTALSLEIVERLRHTLGPEVGALRVAPRDAIAPTVRPELAPDLVVHLESETCAMGYCELHGAVWAPSSGLTGYHRMDGILVMSGPGIRAGQWLPPVHMVDCAPTFLHLLEADQTEGLEGRVLAEFLTTPADSIAPRPAAGSMPAVEVDHVGETGLDDVAEITRRLAALGYMG